MTHLNGTFSAFPVSVVLDGAGNGVISFGPNGSNVRITNRSVKVATSTKQAVATTYKGFQGDNYRIDGTNSGSTGDNNSASVDLRDGELLYVAWVGGDPGATATATFSGYQLPFNQPSPNPTPGNWVNPIAAGDGSLVYPALKSPNYVAGVSGWMIARDGSAEFNSVTVRGTLQVNGTNGKYVLITSVFGSPIIQLYPGAMSNAVNNATDTAQISVANLDVPSDHRFKLSLNAPTSINQNTAFLIVSANYESTGGGHIDMNGQSYTGSPFALNVAPVGDGVITIRNNDIGRGWINGTGATSNSASIGATETVVLTLPSYTYKAGRAYKMVVNGLLKVSAAPNAPIWQIRKTNATGQVLNSGIFNIAGTAVGYTSGATCYFLVGGADVTASLVLTLTGGAAFNVFLNAAATVPFTFDVYDDGVTTSRVGPVTLV